MNYVCFEIDILFQTDIQTYLLLFPSKIEIRHRRKNTGYMISFIETFKFRQNKIIFITKQNAFQVGKLRR